MKRFFVLLVIGTLFFIPNANADLVGYWNFNEGEGGVAHDSSLYGNHGTLTGPEWAPGKNRAGLLFQTQDPVANDYVSVPDSDSLDLRTALTMTAWIKLYNTNGPQTIISKSEDYSLKISDLNSRVSLTLTGPTPGPSGGTSFNKTELRANHWYHIAVTYDGSKVQFYLNGIPDGTEPGVSGSIETNTNFLYIGGDDIHGRTMNQLQGTIDDVRIYNTALSQGEIVSIMNEVDEPLGQPPIADAGQDIISVANTKVVLDASNSYDLDGTIIKYVWTRLPDNTVLCDSTEPICETFSLGRAEEVIELEVTDNDFNHVTDRVSIFYEKLVNLCGNGNVDPPEVCDGQGRACQTTQNYLGTQQCNAQCSDYDTCISTLFCGDSIQNGPEVCDGNILSCTTTSGYAGTMACNAQCTAFSPCTSNLFCGDGIKNGSEICDEGPLLNGQPKHCNSTCSGITPKWKQFFRFYP